MPEPLSRSGTCPDVKEEIAGYSAMEGCQKSARAQILIGKGLSKNCKIGANLASHLRTSYTLPSWGQ